MSKCPFHALYPFRYALGEPGKGVHSYRIFGLAAWDLFLTVVGAVVLAYFFKSSIWFSFLILFTVGEIAHYVFCCPTAFLKLLIPTFGD
jgi:hypothetical protein